MGATALVEAWDLNASRESLAGLVVGIDRRVWRAVALRTEGLVLRVTQSGRDAWLGGFTLGARMRRSMGLGRLVVDIGVGHSWATVETPPGATASNYLATAGGGFEIPLKPALLELGARWFHISNNGREGRHRNPDIQAIGLVLAIGWENQPRAPPLKSRSP